MKVLWYENIGGKTCEAELSEALSPMSDTEKAGTDALKIVLKVVAHLVEKEQLTLAEATDICETYGFIKLIEGGEKQNKT